MKKLLFILSVGMCVGDLVAVSKKHKNPEEKAVRDPELDAARQRHQEAVNMANWMAQNPEFSEVEVAQARQNVENVAMENELQLGIRESNDYWTTQLESERHPRVQETSVYPHSEDAAVYVESEWSLWDNVIKPYFKKSQSVESASTSSTPVVEPIVEEPVVQPVVAAQAVVVSHNQLNTVHVAAGAVAAVVVAYTTYKLVKYAYGKWKNYAIQQAAHKPATTKHVVPVVA